MDFFQAQEEARRNTGLLVAYFVLAVALIVVAVYLAMLLAVGAPEISLWDPVLFFAAAAATLTLVAGGTIYKIVALASGGGAAVAESLDGRLLVRASADFTEQRLLNVVDEMAIASGVAVPPVYLIEEPGINAFAAGVAPNDAVIAVTRGALEQLTRDELQGVVGHEFSHVLNGDMRLNLRLIGVLHGILLLALLGRGLLRGGGRNKDGAAAVAIGLALMIIGYIGVFFGRLIKAAVSRQREFLADAAALQFTRNPAGIAGALKKIAGVGSQINHPRAEEASHLFFGAAIESWFATHPPIMERIRRIEPSFVAPDAMPVVAAAPADGIGIEPHAFAAAAGTVSASQVNYAQQLLAGLPETVTKDLHRPEGTRALIYGLLLAADPAVAHGQLTVIAAREGEALRASAEAHALWLRSAGVHLRLPLVDLALPALRQMEPAERDRFLDLTATLVRADRRIQIFEYTLERILARHLRPRAPRPSTTLDVRAIGADCALVLSALAYAGNRGAAVETAFAAARALAPLDGEWPLAACGEVSLPAMAGALDRLATLAPRFKRRLVEACAAAVSSDGKVTVAEAELLRAVCEAVEVPMPPLVAAA